MSKFKSPRTKGQSAYLNIRRLNFIISLSIVYVKVKPIINLGIRAIDTHVNIYLEITMELQIVWLYVKCANGRMMWYLLESNDKTS